MLSNYSKDYDIEKKLWSAPDTIVKVSGDNQTAMENQVLAQPIKVKILDNLNRLLKNIFTYFTVSKGGGSTEPKSMKTDAKGIATTYWTLGTGEQALTASVKNLMVPKYLPYR